MIFWNGRRQRRRLWRGIWRRLRPHADPRVTAPFATLTDSVLLFLTLMVILGTHSYIYVEVIEKLPDERVLTKINILIAYVVAATLLVTTIVALARYFLEGRHLMRLSGAFRRVAAGDFSTRLPPRRQQKPGGGGEPRKDYIDVMYDDFNAMARELSTIETLKTDFISNVSHEIKTPLAIISGYAQRLRHEQDLSGDERRECVDAINDATRLLSALVGNILRLNKLENSGVMPASPPYDLGEEIRLAALDFEDLWERKGIVFEAYLEEDALVTADKGMTRIVWNNLIANAVKFTPSGGRVTVALRCRESAAVVTVSDTGCGMDAETSKRAFDKFYQADRSHAAEGNGLGLALVKKIVELAGGSVSVESEPDRGSAFTVRLPLAAAPPGA